MEAAPRPFGPLEFPTVFPRRCFSGNYLSVNRKSLFSEYGTQECGVKGKLAPPKCEAGRKMVAELVLYKAWQLLARLLQRLAGLL